MSDILSYTIGEISHGKILSYRDNNDELLTTDLPPRGAEFMARRGGMLGSGVLDNWGWGELAVGWIFLRLRKQISAK